jgi:hypothetical protein
MVSREWIALYLHPSKATKNTGLSCGHSFIIPTTFSSGCFCELLCYAETMEDEIKTINDLARLIKNTMARKEDVQALNKKSRKG